MARHISELNIKSYRGITDLTITDLSNINIFVGDNNCGKTSLLEAIQILIRPFDFENIVMVARQRDRFRVMNPRFTQSQFSSFLNIFNKLQPELNVSLGFQAPVGDVNVSLTGEVNESLLSEEQLRELSPFNGRNKHISGIDEEIKTFFGKLTTESNLSLFPNESIDVTLNKYSRIMRPNKTEELCELEYLSPIDHVINDRFNAITRTKDLREEVIDILQSSFDANIQDLRTIEEDDGRTFRAIDHKLLGDMPLSTYGDGIKKVIALANAAASIRDGILLIDEYETSIHPEAMEQVFKFLLDFCKNRNIQLFLTTHSLEAIDKLLYHNENELENIRIIKLKRNHEKTYARVLEGRKAEQLRIDNDAELR